jgi:hypothetical protein
VRSVILVSVIVVTLSAAAGSAAATDDVAPALNRVRSTSPVIGALITQASAQSQTFRELIQTISSTDGVVYVEEGECGFGVQACLARVTTAGDNRWLWVFVNIDTDDWELMGSIGHELQHALEVLNEPSVDSTAAMFMLYSRIGWRGFGRAFETYAAVETGTAIRAEILKSQRAD